MATKKSRIISKNGGFVSNSTALNPWNFPGQGRELLTEKFSSYTNLDQLELQKERFIKRKKLEGYRHLDQEHEILEVFKHKSNGKMDLFYMGRVCFFVWEYSQLLRVIDNKEERDMYLDGLSDGEAALILKHLREVRVTNCANFINEFGGFELSKSNQLEARFANGEPKWITRGQSSYTEKMDLTIFDLSLPTIKRAIKELNINFPRKKVDKSKNKS